jgi:hypothetical protein
MEDDSLLNEVVLPAWLLRDLCFGNDLTYFFVAEWRAEDVHADVAGDSPQLGHVAARRRGSGVAARGARATAAVPVIGCSTERFPLRAQYTRSPASRGARPGSYCNALQQFRFAGLNKQSTIPRSSTAGTSLNSDRVLSSGRHQIGSPTKR